MEFDVMFGGPGDVLSATCFKRVDPMQQTQNQTFLLSPPNQQMTADILIINEFLLSVLQDHPDPVEGGISRHVRNRIL